MSESNITEKTNKQEFIDFMGNSIREGDLILYTGTEVYPHVSEATNISGNRCYFKRFAGNKHFGGEINAFRDIKKVISLTEFDVTNKDEIKIYYRHADGNSDLRGKEIEIGARVVYVSDETFCFGIVEKLTELMCIIRSENGDRIRRYKSHVLVVEKQ